MSAKAANRILVALSIIVLLVTAIAITALLRGEDTRNVVERVDSACARANVSNPNPADVAECARIRVQADKDQSLRDACVQIRKTFKPKWLEIVTRCARGMASQGSPTVSQRPSRSGVPSVSDRPDITTPSPDRPRVPGRTPAEPPAPDRPSPPDRPSLPTPPVTNPPVVDPPSPPSTPRPSVSLPDVNVGVDSNGVCAGIGGIKVAVGSC